MSEPASHEPEVAFLRSQVSVLTNRLCDTLTQQVAQQQTVLIAAMQTNLALTQTVDRLNRVVDGLAESLELVEKEQEAREQESREARPAGSDFGAILSTLVPYLLGKAPQPNQNQKDPPPFTLPKEVTELMRNRSVAQQAEPIRPPPGAPVPVEKKPSRKQNSKENAT